MTTETMETRLRELVEDRWTRATQRPVRFRDEPGIGTNTSKVYRCLHDALEELAARLVGEVSATEMDGLDTVIGELEETISDRLCEWAIGVETARTAKVAVR